MQDKLWISGSDSGVGSLGSVGPEGSSQDTEWDGFAFDNITIRKRDVTFGTQEVVSDTLTFTDLVQGLPRK